MKVPTLDLKKHHEPIQEELKTAIEEVLSSNRFIGGPKITHLEAQIADYTKTRHAIAVSSGTDALLVSLMALDIGRGDNVLTTPYSFFATVGAILRVGATPVFVDIDDTYNIDPSQIGEQMLEKLGIKAIIPVHLFGQCTDMEPILGAANMLDIPIIEDAAQALGATYPSYGNALPAGSMGKLGCFSFFPSKNLGAMGDAGMVVTDDEELADKVRLLRNHGAKPKYHYSLVGGNFRMDALQAAVLSVKLPYLNRWNEMRRKRAAYYDTHLNNPYVRKPLTRWYREHRTYNQYVISVGNIRDELRAHLKRHDIDTEVYYPVPLHLQPCLEYIKYGEGDFPRAEYAAKHSLALPLYPELTKEQQDFVIEEMRGVL